MLATHTLTYRTTFHREKYNMLRDYTTNLFWSYTPRCHCRPCCSLLCKKAREITILVNYAKTRIMRWKNSVPTILQGMLLFFWGTLFASDISSCKIILTVLSGTVRNFILIEIKIKLILLRAYLSLEKSELIKHMLCLHNWNWSAIFCVPTYAS